MYKVSSTEVQLRINKLPVSNDISLMSIRRWPWSCNGGRGVVFLKQFLPILYSFLLIFLRIRGWRLLKVHVLPKVSVCAMSFSPWWYIWCRQLLLHQLIILSVARNLERPPACPWRVNGTETINSSCIWLQLLYVCDFCMPFEGVRWCPRCPSSIKKCIAIVATYSILTHCTTGHIQCNSLSWLLWHAHVKLLHRAWSKPSSLCYTSAKYE